ncbi:hypothetical protein SAMN04488132_104236 [Sediminibacterium ginsengisoli]|uniref:AAA-like domain-containing protein n=2 Tax=Sediminibacterium ginsengisoli TaxID=413434 RepID=A0A1T4NFP8_9BACT|nr:hypothetical protein SAMN04488132_104236 [Sediminibacterium ginsengisoli]
MGKSHLLVYMALQDIRNGTAGVAVIDPHGDAAEQIIKQIPVSRKHDLIYLNAGANAPLPFNPLENRSIEQQNLLASEIVSILRRKWRESWGDNLEFIIRHCILALLECPKTTLLDIQPFLTNKKFRDAVLKRVNNTGTLNYWINIFNNYSPSQQQSAIAPVLNKAGSLIANRAVQKIMGQRTGSISIPDIVENRKILIVNLSKGIIGEQAAEILGSMITSSIQMAVMRKAQLPESKRSLFYAYFDEAHVFISPSFAEMLSECRKYKLGLFLCHQYLDQLTEDTKNAILGNVGTMVTFRLGLKDARVFKDEFFPVFAVKDFINLPRYYFYIKLLIDGVASKAFSAISGEP